MNLKIVALIVTVMSVGGVMAVAVSSALGSSVVLELGDELGDSLTVAEGSDAAGGSYVVFEDNAPVSPPVTPAPTATPAPTSTPAPEPTPTPPPAPTPAPSDDDCSIFVSTSGNDGSNGSSLATAIRSAGAAVQRASAGDVVCFAPGNHGGLNISGKSGTAANPIVFTALDPDNKPVFSLGGLTQGGTIGAVYVNNSQYIEVKNFEATNSLRGSYIDSSAHVLFEGCEVHDVGQEGIHIGAGLNKSLPVASFVTIRGCEIYRTGSRPGTDTSQNLAYSVFGEQIYVGFGDGSDRSHDIIIEDNLLRNNSPATAEAVNVKSGTFNITIRNNHIRNIDSWCEGAIRVNHSNNLKVQGNIIHDITASGRGGNGAACTQANAIRLGNFNNTGSSSNILVEDNIVWNAQLNGLLIHGGVSGIFRNNTVFNSGRDDFQNLAGANIANSVSSDGSSGSARKSTGDFVGPLNGDADAGQGPGSGYVLRSPDGNGSRKY